MYGEVGIIKFITLARIKWEIVYVVSAYIMVKGPLYLRFHYSYRKFELVSAPDPADAGADGLHHRYASVGVEVM